MRKSRTWNLSFAREFLTSLRVELKDIALLGKEEILNHLISFGKEIPTRLSNPKPDHLVNECQSQVYLFLEKKEETLEFSGSSDSLILKGFLGILFKTLNGLTCSEVEELWEDLSSFLNSSDIPQSLTPNRKMGLSSILNFAYSLQEKTC